MKKFLDALAKGIDFVGGVMVLVMTLLIILQVVMRYVFSSPLKWTEELARFLFIYITFVGGSLLVYQRGHLYVEILFASLSKRAKKVATLIIDVIVLAFSAFVIYSAIFLMDTVSGSFSTAMNIPMQYISFSVCLGAILMVLFSSYNVYRDVYVLKNPEADAEMATGLEPIL